MKKIVIIGGGVSGLSAGIHAQLQGYQTEIYEKNAVPGGECTAWERQGYLIDNCIHWLTGCRETDELHSLWETLGVLGENVPLYHDPYFYMLEMDGKQLHFWRNLEKTRTEFLAVAPEDEAELNRFFDAVRRSECMRIPCVKSPAHMSPFAYMGFGMKMAPMGKVMKEYGNMTVSELAAKFRNPLVREMMGRYYQQNFMAYTLIVSYAFFTSGTAAIPVGGSRGVAERMSARYRALGGQLHLNAPVKHICIEHNHATGIELADGSTIYADGVICATDTAVTFPTLLDNRYMDKNLKKMYDDRAGYPVNSAFQVALGIRGKRPEGLPSGSVMFPCAPYTAATQSSDFLAVRFYDYDESLFPADGCVLQCNLMQNEADFAYWKALRADREAYSQEKQRLAEIIAERICAQYPQLQGKLTLLGTYSPATLERWCGAYRGAYMSFFPQAGRKSLYAKNTVKGLSNVFLAGQWLQCSGGLPIAAASGKFAVQALSRMK